MITGSSQWFKKCYDLVGKYMLKVNNTGNEASLMDADPVSLMLTLKYLPAEGGLFHCKVTICNSFERSVKLLWIIWRNIIFSWKVILFPFASIMLWKFWIFGVVPKFD